MEDKKFQEFCERVKWEDYDLLTLMIVLTDFSNDQIKTLTDLIKSLDKPGIKIIIDQGDANKAIPESAGKLLSAVAGKIKENKVHTLYLQSISEGLLKSFASNFDKDFNLHQFLFKKFNLSDEEVKSLNSIVAKANKLRSLQLDITVNNNNKLHDVFSAIKGKDIIKFVMSKDKDIAPNTITKKTAENIAEVIFANKNFMRFSTSVFTLEEGAKEIIEKAENESFIEHGVVETKKVDREKLLSTKIASIMTYSDDEIVPGVHLLALMDKIGFDSCLTFVETQFNNASESIKATMEGYKSKRAGLSEDKQNELDEAIDKIMYGDSNSKNNNNAHPEFFSSDKKVALTYFATMPKEVQELIPKIVENNHQFQLSRLPKQGLLEAFTQAMELDGAIEKVDVSTTPLSLTPTSSSDSISFTLSSSSSASVTSTLSVDSVTQNNQGVEGGHKPS